jgi:hypothetical protein
VQKLFRSTNITKFSWKSAYEEFAKNCPLTHDIFSIISGNKEKQTPRLVSSMGVLLFTRNQKMNTLQAINSVLMFRGHVRSRVSKLKLLRKYFKIRMLKKNTFHKCVMCLFSSFPSNIKDIYMYIRKIKLSKKRGNSDICILIKTCTVFCILVVCTCTFVYNGYIHCMFAQCSAHVHKCSYFNNLFWPWVPSRHYPYNPSPKYY